MTQNLEWILGQAELPMPQMEIVIQMAKALGVTQVISYTPATLGKLLSQFDSGYVKLIVTDRAEERRFKDVLWEPAAGTTLRNVPGIGLSRIVVLIGPPEGFSADLLRQAESAGYVPVGLGFVTRAPELSALYAISCIHSLLFA